MTKSPKRQFSSRLDYKASERHTIAPQLCWNQTKVSFITLPSGLKTTSFTCSVQEIFRVSNVMLHRKLTASNLAVQFQKCRHKRRTMNPHNRVGDMCRLCIEQSSITIFINVIAYCTFSCYHAALLHSSLCCHGTQ